MAIGACAQAQIKWGIRGGVFIPSSAELRDGIDDAWYSWGIGPMNLGSKRGRVMTGDIQVISHSGKGNRALMLLPTYGLMYTREEKQGETFVPYVAARVGPSYVDYRLTTGSGTFSGRRWGSTGNVEVGAFLGPRFRVHARYDALSKMQGINFSGLSAGVTLQF